MQNSLKNKQIQQNDKQNKQIAKYKVDAITKINKDMLHQNRDDKMTLFSVTKSYPPLEHVVFF